MQKCDRLLGPAYLFASLLVASVGCSASASEFAAPPHITQEVGTSLPIETPLRLILVAFEQENSEGSSAGESEASNGGDTAAGSNRTTTSEATQRSVERFSNRGDRDPPLKAPRPRPRPPYDGARVPSQISKHFVAAIKEYNKIIKEKPFVTSGLRTPKTSAKAMYDKFELGGAGDYKRTSSFIEVLSAYTAAKAAAKNPDQIKAAMQDVIARQVKENSPVSRHLTGRAVDLRHFNPHTGKQVLNVHILEPLIMKHGGGCLLVEFKPRHVHIDYPPPPCGSHMMADSNPNRAAPSAIKLGALQTPDADNMSCSITSTASGPALAMTLPRSHGPEIIIVDPKDVYWSMVYDMTSATFANPALRNPKSVQGLRKLSLDVEKTMGLTWIGALIGPKRVFSWTGDYTVMVGRSLDADIPLIDSWCRVHVSLP